MGKIKEPEPVKLVMPMFGHDPTLFAQAIAELEKTFGPTDYVSEIIPFTFTHYYQAEFGADLLRQFASFERLIGQDELADVKVLTNELEYALGQDGKRGLNLDPGYMSPGKFVLATTKNYSQRIYIGKGIFAEVTLYIRDGRFCTWPWTYSDYASKEYAQILGEIRALYMEQRKARQTYSATRATSETKLS